MHWSYRSLGQVLDVTISTSFSGCLDGAERQRGSVERPDGLAVADGEQNVPRGRQTHPREHPHHRPAAQRSSNIPGRNPGTPARRGTSHQNWQKSSWANRIAHFTAHSQRFTTQTDVSVHNKK